MESNITQEQAAEALGGILAEGGIAYAFVIGVEVFVNPREDLSDRQNIVSAIIDGSTFERKETKSYPGAALREVVMNAFCHAAYFIRSNIKIEFFPEHARITSPGGIYNATMDDIMHGVQTYIGSKMTGGYYIKNGNH